MAAATRSVAVAYSGGRDSTALLHATAVEAAQHEGLHVVALHVHHGLSTQADAWLAHCEAQCARWARRGLPVEFAAERLSAAPAAGESVEAWARDARYRALSALAQARGVRVVLLAHHQRDQAETLLLQALRGAGTAGLSGMPRGVVRDGIEWQRPWLDRSSDAIAAYVRRHRLRHIVDDSNADPRFARNRLRLDVWPALSAAFPQAEATLATAASWAQQAEAVLAEVAQEDLARVADGVGLRVPAWLALPEARRSNVLRAWLRQPLGGAAPASLVARLLAELPSKRSARWPLDDGSELRVYRGMLRREARLPTAASSPPQRESVLGVTRAGAFALPGWHGVLHVETVSETGVPLAWLARVELRERRGGEQFQAGLGRPPRSLKKQFQAAGVAEWARGGPLVFSGGQLVFVPGLGLDARVIGLPGQPLVALRWEPDRAAA
ncbi:MAG TPA: tRNA lysidine(34) synthetase TilS [Burkholderiaceae bacterium]|jgi:tRNA(Ile)-lysidine synthase